MVFSTILRRQVVLLLCVALAGFVALLAPTPVRAATFTVINTNDTGAGSLRDAISQANTGDTVTFASGVSGTIHLLSGLTITKGVTINGPGVSMLTLDGGNAVTVLTVNAFAAVTISGLTITNGGGASGSGIVVSSGATLTLNASIVSGNRAGNGAGIVAGSSSTVTLNYCIVSGNVATNTGGGIYVFDSATVTVNYSTVSGNMASTGGGIESDYINATVTLNNVTLSGNTASGSGGGVNTNGTVIITDSILKNNSGTFGGGIVSQGSAKVTVTDSVVTGNTASVQGGAVANFGSKVVIFNSEISGNTVDNDNGQGGGIYQSNGSTIIANSTLSGNMVTGTDAGGGALTIFNGVLKLINSTVANNSVNGASSSGGGLQVTGGTLTATNTIIAGNAGASAPDVLGPVTTGGDNIVGKADSSSGWGSSDLTGTIANPLNVKLGPLADNGGKAPQRNGASPKTPSPKLPDGTHPRTQAIDSTSPAYHAGKTTTCTTAYPDGANSQDERGPSFPRSAATCSVGAFEPLQAAPPTPTSLHPTGATNNSVTWGWTNADPSAPLIFTVDGTHFYGLAAGTTTYTLYGIAYGSYGCMALAAYNAYGASAYTAYSCNNVLPITPYNPHVTGATSSSVSFGWANYDSLSSIAAFDGTTNHALGVNATSYTAPVAAGYFACVTVAAYNATNTSPYSPWACGLALPAMPTNVHVTGHTTTSVSFAWTNHDPYSGIALTNDGVHLLNEGINATSYTQNGLASGQYACIEIAAYNSSGASPYTSWVCGQAN